MANENKRSDIEQSPISDQQATPPVAPVQPEQPTPPIEGKKSSKKWLWIIVVVILILSVIIYFVVYYFINPRVVRTESEVVTSCIDKDGDDIYIKGITKFRHSESEFEGRGTLEDWCEYYAGGKYNRVGLIREGICEDDKLKQVFMTCGWGYVCRNGACVKGDKESTICYDSDGGKNITKKGEIIGYGGSGEDRCWVSIDGTTTNGGATTSCETEFVNSGRCFVSEYYCDGDSKRNEIIPCPNGCSEGACL
tara:strand:+ start:90 stop:842 length:753 start_codon:yes stop_codon:yes gene_type:complete